MPRLRHEHVFRYPIFTAAGSPRELGRQHGEQARMQIVGYVGWMCESLKLTQPDIERESRKFRPLFAKHCPRMLEEVHGLAEATGLSIDMVLASQIRGELGEHSVESCTTFVLGPQATTNGETIIGQTCEMDGEIRDFAYVLNLQPDGLPEVLMWTFGGVLGNRGLNEHGIAQFADPLGGRPDWRTGIPHDPLRRMILEQPDVAAVHDVVNSYPVCSSGSYLLCDGAGTIQDLEITPDGTILRKDNGASFFAHSNQLPESLHDNVKNDSQGLPDPNLRLDRVRSPISQQMGAIDIDSMKSILADHEGQPASICRHADQSQQNGIHRRTSRTVVAMIAEPSRGRMHIASGNPCISPFREYRLSRSPLTDSTNQPAENSSSVADAS